ncbi:MAG: hypothetical protein ACSHX3_11685 [Litorimonas sp.]
MSLVCLMAMACTEATSNALDSGGIEPPPGFLTRTDANCRAAAANNSAIGVLTDTSPTIRQLNGQSLFGYSALDGSRVQCVVRHADESVVDIRIFGSD